MSSTTPPPPKHSGSGPFIAAIVVMLLLMGGLIYWKLGGSESKPAAPPPVATVVPPALDEPPPPPPPPEEPKDAGAEPKPTKRGVVASVGGCNGECKGTESPSFRGQLKSRAMMAQGCYTRALRQNNHLQGRMRVSLRVGPTGSVCSANITKNEVGDPGIGTCVLQIFRASTFAAPQGGCVDAEVPLNFEPKT